MNISVDTTTLIGHIKRIKSIAETGLVYAGNEYDKERYGELKEISLDLIALISNQPIEFVSGFFQNQTDYPTPKTDLRAVILNEKQEILLVRESADGRWSLPGGWADIGDTPTEGIIREIKEETGLQAQVVRLLAIYDKDRHPYPQQPFYVYKLIFHCSYIGDTLTQGFDIQDVNWFSVHDLPAISENRILPTQIIELHHQITTGDPNLFID